MKQAFVVLTALVVLAGFCIVGMDRAHAARKRHPNDGIAFKAIEDRVKGMTTAQIEQTSRQLHGAEIRWDAWIADVDETWFKAGTYTVRLKMDPEDWIYKVQFDTKDAKAALSLRVGQAVRVTGYIDGVNTFLGITVTLYSAQATPRK